MSDTESFCNFCFRRIWFRDDAWVDEFGSTNCTFSGDDPSVHEPVAAAHSVFENGD